MQPYYIGRQPIFDQKLNVFGYELLYRTVDGDLTDDFDGDLATTEIIANSFLEIGLPKLVGNRKAFINLTRKFIDDHSLLPSQNNRLVLEVLENIEVDDAICLQLKKLKNAGYVLALDDFTMRSDHLRLVPYVDIIKLELPALDDVDLFEHVRALREYNVKLLAEKIETQEEYEYCRELGIDYFQGFFLSRPKIIKGKKLPINRIQLLKMVAEINHPETNINKLNGIISSDVSLSYKLLKYLNSAVYKTAQEITSIKHALVYLGDQEVRNWATMIMLSSLSGKPDELMANALMRGRMCELLCAETGQGDPESAFLVGIFSLLDAMMDAPLDQLLENITMASSIKEALLSRRGDYAVILNLVIAYERSDWVRVEEITPIDLQKVGAIYLVVVSEVDEIMKLFMG